MSKIYLNQNMSWMDRLSRGGLGLALLVKGSQVQKPWQALLWVGGALLVIPSITGTDPVMKKFGASTRPEAENFVLNLINKGKPGHGILPILTQQASPGMAFRPAEKKNTLAGLLAIS